MMRVGLDRIMAMFPLSVERISNEIIEHGVLALWHEGGGESQDSRKEANGVLSWHSHLAHQTG
jgi:hypothetical protein